MPRGDHKPRNEAERQAKQDKRASERAGRDRAEQAKAQKAARRLETKHGLRR